MTPPQSIPLPYCGVDSHAHLDSKEFTTDLIDVLARARQCGVAYIINIFLGPEEYTTGRALFAEQPQVFFALGLHPCDAELCTEKNLAAMEEAFLHDTRLRAVGEIGLDFYWKQCPPEIQYHAFKVQLELAKKLNKPVLIHSREATSVTIDILEKAQFQDYPLLWHCFGGNVDEAQQIIRNGWHISIPGPVSYPRNTTLREAVNSIPLDRLMLETDCPYLAPLEWRGKRNEPALCVFTAAAMAEARQMDVTTLWQACGQNACRFFGISD